MTTELQAIDTINNTIFGGTFTGITDKSKQIAWQGLPFDVPETNFIRVEIDHLSSSQIGFGTSGGIGVGTRRFRRTGLLTVQCFVPAKTGAMVDVVTLAVEVKNLFEGATINGIRFLGATIQELPPLEADWLQTNVSVTFEYDEQK